MKQTYAKASNLSCLLSANKESEVIPEPFRMQPDVIFKVTYSEYINYVLSLSTMLNVCLMSDVKVLSDMATVGNPKLYNSFLADVAFAIVKELYFASVCRRTASIILPASFNDNNVGIRQVIGAYADCVVAKAEFMRKCKSRGYELPTELSGQNAVLYQLAVVMYNWSMKQTVVKEVNLEYDV